MNHQMFSFRFKLPPTLEANLRDHDIMSGDREPLVVSQDKYAIHVRSANRFETEEQARTSMLKVLHGLNFLGLFLGYGIGDFRFSAGDDRRPGPVEDLRIVAILGHEELNIERAVQMLNRVPAEIPERYRTAAKLFDDSYFVEQRAVALVLRTTGLEVLSPPRRMPPEIVEGIEQAIGHLKQLDLPAAVMDRLTGALGQRKNQSISEAVREHISSVVPEAPGDVIKSIYETRSKIVHGQQVDRTKVFEDSENAATLLRYTVLRELGFTMPEPSFRDT